MTSTSRWTPEMDDRLRKMWAAGAKAGEIAEAFGYAAKETIYLRAKAISLPARVVETSRSVWTPDRIERLRALWAAGLSCSQIGVEMGCGRNAIIGAAHRYEMPRRAGTLKTRTSEAKGEARARRPQKVRRPSRQKPAPAPRPVLKAEPIVEIVPTGRTPVRFLASGDFVCKVFLPGEPLGPDGLVCGNPVNSGSPVRFCAACCAAMRIGAFAKPPREGDKSFFKLPKTRVAA